MGVKQPGGFETTWGATRQAPIVHSRKDRRPEKPDAVNKKARTVRVRAWADTKSLRFLVDRDSGRRCSSPAGERTALGYSHDHRDVACTS